MTTETEIHSGLVVAEFVLAAITFIALRFVVAPYGRHERPGWGPTIPARLGWVVMEAPSSVGFIWLWSVGAHAGALVPSVLLGMWSLHYVHRTFIFPFRMKMGGKRMPFMVVGIAVVFNVLNTYVNARWISHLGSYEDAWLTSVPMCVGAAVFAVGMVINLRADTYLASLRKSPGDSYVLPKGGLFDLVVQPNYLGELLEWVGWAIATWSWAGAAFAVYTFANLAPRARDNRAWYQARFKDFPERRRAMIPWLW